MLGLASSRNLVCDAVADVSSPSSGEIAIEFCSYHLNFGLETLLQNVTFALRSGESMAVIGPTGAGKSVLLKVISQIFWTTFDSTHSLLQRGTAKVLGSDIAPAKPSPKCISAIRSRAVMLEECSSWLPLSISENFVLAQTLSGVSDVLPYRQIIDDLSLSERNRAILDSFADLLPSQVETPFLQQLAVIRALLHKPALLLLDEPCLRMDPVLLRQTENLILEHATQATVLWATNDLYQASRVADRILFLCHGMVVECEETPKFFTNPKTREAENFIAGRDDAF